MMCMKSQYLDEMTERTNKRTNEAMFGAIFATNEEKGWDKMAYWREAKHCVAFFKFFDVEEMEMGSATAFLSVQWHDMTVERGEI